MTGSRLRPTIFVGLFLGLLAVALQGVQSEELEAVPSEDLCRPYIEKALKDLGTGSLEQTSAEDGADGDEGSHEDGAAAVSEEASESGPDGSDEGKDEEKGESAEDEAVKIDTEESTEDTAEDKRNDEKDVEDGEKASAEDEQADEAPGKSAEASVGLGGGDEGKDEKSEEKADDGIGEKVESTEATEADQDSGDEDDKGTSDEEAKIEEEKFDEDQEAADEGKSEEVGVATEEEQSDEGTDETADSKTEDDGDSKAEEDDDSKADEDGDSKPEDDGDSKAEDDGDSKAEDDGDSKAEDDGDSKVEDDADSKADEDGDSKAEVDDDSKTEDDGDSKAEDDGDSKADEDADSKAEDDGDSKAEDDGDSKAEDDGNSKAEDDGDSKAEDDGDSKAEEASQEKGVEASDGESKEEGDGGVSKEDSVEGDSKDDDKTEEAEDSKEPAEEESGSKEEGAGESKEGDEQAESAKSTEDQAESGEAADEKMQKSRARREVGEEGESEEQGDSKEGDEDSEATPSEEAEPTPEEDLIQEIEIPENLRPRDHINQLLRLDEENEEKERAIEKVADIILRDLKRLYDNAIKPLETLYKYRDLSNRHFGDPEIFSKPLVLFMGPWSGGKSSIINYLLDIEYKQTSLRTGAEPSPAYFNILMHGEEEEILDGTQLAADWTFSGLQKFGQGMLDRLRGLRLNNNLLEKVNIVEIPGILEIRKQVQRLFPFNDACQWFIDRADIIFLVYDPSKLDVGPETEAILDQLKGREYQTRIILNKADQVRPEELMRVQGALIWNISPLMSSAEPPIMYSTSLWSLPYEAGAPTRLLYAQERAFLRDLRSAIDKRVEHKIASARRFAVRVRNHAKMVDCYLTTYYNHKTFFGNKKEISDKIIENPQDYHIYEGLSTLTNISRYDLPDPDVYRDFFRLNSLYDFQLLSSTCTYFRGCPINRLDVAIAYDLPELVGKYKKSVEAVLHENEANSPPS